MIIVLVAGAVIGVGLLFLVGGEKPAAPEEQVSESKVTAVVQEITPPLSQEELEREAAIRKREAASAALRREHLLGKLSASEREAFEDLASELRDQLDSDDPMNVDASNKKPRRKKQSNIDSFCLDILIIFGGILLILGLAALTTEQIPTITQIIGIFKAAFPSSSSSSATYSTDSPDSFSPFGKSSMDNQDL